MVLQDKLSQEFKNVLGDLLTSAELVDLLNTDVYELIELLEDDIIKNYKDVAEAIEYDEEYE